MLDERLAGESYEPADGHDGAQHVQELDGGNLHGKRLAFEIPVMRDLVYGAIRRRGDLARPYTREDIARPAFRPLAKPKGAHRAGPEGAGRGKHLRILSRAQARLLLRQGNAGPGGTAAGEHRLHLGEQDDAGCALPPGQSLLPFLYEVRRQSRRSLRPANLEKHRLAMSVRVSMQQLHAAEVLQQHQDGDWHGADARELVAVVGQLGGGSPAHANDIAEHQPPLEDVRPEGIALPGNEVVSIADEVKRLIETWCARYGPMGHRPQLSLCRAGPR